MLVGLGERKGRKRKVDKDEDEEVYGDAYYFLTSAAIFVCFRMESRMEFRGC